MNQPMESVAVYMLSVIALIFLLLYRQSERKRQKAQSGMPERSSAGAADIVGKSSSVFMEPVPKTAAGQSFHSQPLEREEKTLTTEPDISPDEIQASLPVFPDAELPDALLFDDEDALADELSQGLTFEQISHAVDVAQGRKTGYEDECRAGETFTVMPADMLDFIIRQEGNLARVTALMDGHAAGSRKQPATPAEFNIGDYV